MQTWLSYNRCHGNYIGENRVSALFEIECNIFIRIAFFHCLECQILKVKIIKLAEVNICTWKYSFFKLFVKKKKKEAMTREECKK